MVLIPHPEALLAAELDLVVCFTVTGLPVAQPRHSVGQGRAYLPATKAAEVHRWRQSIQLEHKAAALGQAAAMLEAEPVFVGLVFCFPRVKRIKTPARSPGHYITADIDNLAKCLLDALNGRAYDDDRRIVRLIVEKWHAAEGEPPGVAVQIGRWRA